MKRWTSEMDVHLGPYLDAVADAYCDGTPEDVRAAKAAYEKALQRYEATLIDGMTSQEAWDNDQVRARALGLD